MIHFQIIIFLVFYKLLFNLQYILYIFEKHFKNTRYETSETCSDRIGIGYIRIQIAGNIHVHQNHSSRRQ